MAKTKDIVIETTVKKLAKLTGAYYLDYAECNEAGVPEGPSYLAIKFNKDSIPLTLFVRKSGIFSLCEFTISLGSPKFFSVLSNVMLGCFKLRYEHKLTGVGDCLKSCRFRWTWSRIKLGGL